MDRVDRAAPGTTGIRYRHVVVGKAHDFNGAHWKMLRAMVAPRQPALGSGDVGTRVVVPDTAQQSDRHTTRRQVVCCRGRSLPIRAHLPRAGEGCAGVRGTDR